MITSTKWKLLYYNQSVADEVQRLHISLKEKYFAIADKMLEHGPNLGMPFTKPLGQGLFEIRAKGQAGIARGFFCTISKNKIIILHVFVKKTEATSLEEMVIGRKRLKEVKENGL